MPLKSGSSKATQDGNFHEFRHGKTFATTAARFGKAKAEKIAQAAGFSAAERNKAKRRMRPRSQ